MSSYDYAFPANSFLDISGIGYEGLLGDHTAGLETSSLSVNLEMSTLGDSLFSSPCYSGAQFHDPEVYLSPNHLMSSISSPGSLMPSPASSSELATPSDSPSPFFRLDSEDPISPHQHDGMLFSTLSCSPPLSTHGDDALMENVDGLSLHTFGSPCHGHAHLLPEPAADHHDQLLLPQPEPATLSPACLSPPLSAPSAPASPTSTASYAPASPARSSAPSPASPGFSASPSPSPASSPFPARRAARQLPYVRRSTRRAAARPSYAHMDADGGDDEDYAPAVVLGKRRASSSASSRCSPGSVSGSSSGDSSEGAADDDDDDEPPRPSKKARAAARKRTRKPARTKKAPATRGCAGAGKIACTWPACAQMFTREGDRQRHMGTTLHPGEVLSAARRAEIYAETRAARRQFCVHCGHILLRVESRRRHEENPRACDTSRTNNLANPDWPVPGGAERGKGKGKGGK